LAVAARGHRGMLAVRVRQILGEGMTMENTSINGTRIVVAGAVLLAALIGPRVANGLRAHDNAKIGENADQTATVGTKVHADAIAPTEPRTLQVRPASPHQALALQQEPPVAPLAVSPSPMVSPVPLAVPAPIAPQVDGQNSGPAQVAWNTSRR
jgi:hypothetical protein